MTPMRVAVVMPPPANVPGDAALGSWPTFTGALEALLATGKVDPIGCCRSTTGASMVERNGVTYYFESSDRRLARRVADVRPAVVHIHGLGFTRLLLSIRHAVGRDVPIVMQHHGEPPPVALRSRVGQRWSRHAVDGYLFTGLPGQAEPFRRAGAISATAVVCEVLESASDLDTAAPVVPPALGGDPCVLWVGRLIASKDPLTAVRAVARARARGSAAELHMLATDRTMEPDVRSLVTSLALSDVVHLHPPAAHADMPGWYRRADIYLSTSHHEGSNYSLIEALGFGCLPVVSDIPSHAAIVKELARPFAVGDADTAGAQLALPISIARRAVVAYSDERLSWTAIADQLIEAYSTIRRA